MGEAGEDGDDFFEGAEEVAPSAEWLAVHVRQSQYLLQVVKCSNRSCCDPLRSNLASILPHRFLPPPIKVTHDDGGLLQVADPNANEGKFVSLFAHSALHIPNIPTAYDWFCPSVQGELENRTCVHCGLYFPTQTSKKGHIKEMHGRGFVASNPAARIRPFKIFASRPVRGGSREVLCQFKDAEGDVDWVDVEELDVDVLDEPPASEPDSDRLPVIPDISKWLASPFTEEL